MTIIRAAISVEKDSKTEISQQAVKLFKTVIERNKNAKITAIFASQTDDLTSFNCCTAIRNEFDLKIALECFQEAHIDNQTPRIIRYTIFCSNDFNPEFVYLDNATVLRPDLATRPETSN